MYQTILPSTHTSLTGVRTSYLDCGTSTVLLPSLLGGLLPLLVFGSNLLAFGPYDLGFFSPLQ